MTEFNTIMFSWKCVTPPGVARKSSSIILTKLATHHVATVKLQDVLKSMVKNTRFIALTHLFCRGYSWKKKQ